MSNQDEVTDPNDPRLGHGVDAEPVAQHAAYLVLSKDERAKGYVRPFRKGYAHVDCTVSPGAHTFMSDAIAETYARNPAFYGATYCCACRMHKGLSEFRWLDERGDPTDLVVGS